MEAELYKILQAHLKQSAAVLELLLELEDTNKAVRALDAIHDSALTMTRRSLVMFASISPNRTNGIVGHG
jgi:hypothetical protein